MNRRGFLGCMLALGAAGTVVCAPSIVRAQSLMRGSGVVFKEQSILVPACGLIREIAAYRISHDDFLVRHDIKFGDYHWHVNTTINRLNDIKNNAEYAKRIRDAAIMALGNELKHRGYDWNDLSYLPLPTSGLVDHKVYISS